MKRLTLVAAACALTLLAAVPAQAQLNGSHSLGDFGVLSGSQPAARLLRRALLLPLRHRHHQGRRRKHVAPHSRRSEQPRARRRGSHRVVREQGQDPGRELRRDGRASLCERVARSPGLPLGRDDRHRRRRHAGPPARPGLAHRARRHRRRVPVLRTHGPLRAGRRRQPREGHVDVRAVPGGHRLLRREEDLQPRRHRLLGDSTARRRTPTSRSGRSSPARRPGQVVPRRRADHRRGVLRPVEAHEGSAGRRSSCRAGATST